MDEFSPSRLVEREDGSFSLTFDDFGATELTMTARGLEGGGYTWHAVVESLVRLHAPELEERVRYDPEGSMFAAYGDDREALLTVAQLIRRAIGDDAVLLEAIDNADEDLLE